MTRALMLGVIALSLLFVNVPAARTQDDAVDPVAVLLSQMSPEAKVGQLVVVGFPGTDLSDDSELAALVREFGIGGVLLRPDNGNFGTSRISAQDLVSVTNRLQELAWEASRTVVAPVTGIMGMSYRPNYVPLFVAVEGGRHGLSATSYVSGTTSVPTLMALGATWDTSLAEQVGTVLGRELSALGVNLFLGPSLDIPYTPRPADPADLGVSVFGSDPFWVGEFGSAYITGLQIGSEGRLLIAPRHLPGLGSADRPLQDEVPTVQKPLEQLKQIELAPFFAAATAPPGQAGVADAFVVTHIRYRGFQGNIRQTTRPISLDAQALQSVVSLPEMAAWRRGGGLLVTDNLGMPSIHRLYDPRGLSFNGRRVAQDALRAGNDLLLLDRFSASGDWDGHFTNVRDTLTFLASQYREDPTIQAVVDAAVARILRVKLRLYPELRLESALVDAGGLSEVLGQAQSISSQVALSAVTRVFPLSEDLLPASPQQGDSIVIFTQVRGVRVGQGESAGRLLVPAPDAALRALLRVYGPDGTGVVRPNTVHNYTFEDLSLALEWLEAREGDGREGAGELFPSGTDTGATAAPAEVVEAIREADWIVFLTTGLDPYNPVSFALKQFLATQANLVNAHLAVLALGPPYELDSTELSKLDLFYALYSPGSAFVETAVRALFRDMPAPGASPVDIPAVNYFIPQQMMPDPNQLITFDLVSLLGEELTDTVRSSIHIGDVINLRTGTIVDRNGNPVPNGTPVHFVLRYPQEGIERILAAESSEGVAQASVTLDRVGQLDIVVQSEPALSSVRLELMIRDDGVTITEVVEPTPVPSPSPEPTATPEPQPTPIPDPPEDKATFLPNPVALPTFRGGRVLAWGGVGALLVAVLGFLLARYFAVGPEGAVRLALSGVLGSLLAYIVMMGIARWASPGLRYGLVSREALAGGVTLLAGALAAYATFWGVRILGMTDRYSEGEKQDLPGRETDQHRDSEKQDRASSEGQVLAQ